MNIRKLTIISISILLVSCISKKHHIINIGPSEKLRNLIVNEVDSVFKLYANSNTIPSKQIPLIISNWDSNPIQTISLKSQDGYRLFHLELDDCLTHILILFKNHKIIGIKETDDIYFPNYFVIKYYHQKFRFLTISPRCYRLNTETTFDPIKQTGELIDILM